MLSLVTITVLRASYVLDLAGYPRDLDPVADGDWPFRQNDQAADEIAGDILEPEPDANTDGAGENSQRAEVNAGIVENNENADDQHNVADNLSNRVLE